MWMCFGLLAFSFVILIIVLIWPDGVDQYDPNR